MAITPRSSPLPLPEVDPVPTKEEVDLLLKALDKLPPSDVIEDCIRDLYFRWCVEEVSDPTSGEEVEWAFCKKQIGKMVKLSGEFFDALRQCRLDKRTKQALLSRGKLDHKEILWAKFRMEYHVYKKEQVAEEFALRFAELAGIYSDTMATLMHRHDQDPKWKKFLRKEVKRPVSAPHLGRSDSSDNLLAIAKIYDTISEPD